MNMDKNGIRYTIFRADAIDGDVLHELLYTHGKDASYEAALEEEIALQRSIWEDECESKSVAAQEAGTDLVLDDFLPYLGHFDPIIDEPIISGTYEGVTYQTTWLGGAQMIWIFASPMMGHFALCSPCVPGACDGGARRSVDDGYMGYDMPPSWRHTEPEEMKSFADRMGEYE